MSNGLPEGEHNQATAALALRVAELEVKVADLQRAVGSAPTASVSVASPGPAAPSRLIYTAPVPPRPTASAASNISFGGLAEKVRTGSGSGSLETDIGSKVLSKVAILLLLVGTAWFLKWAFDNRWIGATGRVLIGLIAGAGLVVWSDRFRRNGTPSFAYALKAVGSGVLYLSLWASFQSYHLVPASVALLAMIAVTAWNAVLALTQDSLLLAGYALLGAYLTPVLLSTGGNHEIFLFSYLGSTAIAVAALLRAKPWNLLLLAPVPVTSAFFIVWWVAFSSGATYTTTATMAMLLWAVFAATPIVARSVDSIIVSVLQPIAAATFGALTMYSVLIDSGHRDAEPWVALGFAGAYLAASRLRRPSLLSAMHLPLALTFVTIAIPLKLTGHGITAGWLAEALAVLYIAANVDLESRARDALAWLGMGAMLLGVFGALIGPAVFESTSSAFANRAFATGVGACVALGVGIVLVRRIPQAARPLHDAADGLLLLLLNVVLLTAFWREIHRALGWGERGDFALSGWMAFQGAMMLAIGFWKRTPLPRWIGLVLLAATIVKTVAYDMRQVETGYRVISYLALGILLLVVSFAYQKDWLGLHAAIADSTEPVEPAEDEA